MAPLGSVTPITLDNTVGAIFLGTLGASLLSGIIFVQCYLYYHNYPQDSMFNKFAVGLLWILDVLHLALVIHGVYFFVVTQYGNIFALQVIPWSLKLQATINVVIIVLVHSLYAQRVWLLGGYHKGVLGYIVALVVASGAVVGFVLAYVIYRSHTFFDLGHSAWAVYAALGTSTSIDFLIAATMCYYLHKSKGGTTRLDSKISKIIQYMISSGLFTSACSLAAMFSYILMPNTFICMSLAFLVTKLYPGSFLAMLNSRERHHKQMSEFFNDTTPYTFWRRSLKLVTNSSASAYSQDSSLTAKLPLQSPPKSALFPQHPSYRWNGSSY